METKRPATYQDVLDAPEHMVAELIDGELFLSPRPAGPHTLVASSLGAHLMPPFGDEGHFFIGSPEAIPLWSPLVTKFLDAQK